MVFHGLHTTAEVLHNVGAPQLTEPTKFAAHGCEFVRRVLLNQRLLGGELLVGVDADGVVHRAGRPPAKRVTQAQHFHVAHKSVAALQGEYVDLLENICLRVGVAVWRCLGGVAAAG
jgi:hypothetical protein